MPNDKWKILLTGGAGFIGYHVGKKLLDQGHKVIVVDNFNPYYDQNLKKARAAQLAIYPAPFPKNKTADEVLHRAERCGASPTCQIIRADIRDFEEMKRIFQENKVDKVVHLAAQAGVRYSLEAPLLYGSTNVQGTLNLIELARQFQIKSFVLASSSSVYGLNGEFPSREDLKLHTPVSLYAASKQACELMAHSYHHLFGMKVTCLRFFNVYGPWGRPDMALYKFTDLISKGKPIEVYNFGEAEKDFTYVDDIAAGVVSAVEKELDYEIINLGNGRPIPLMYYIELIERELGHVAEKKMMPAIPGDVQKSHADITKARQLLGYNPKTSVEVGIKRFVEWYREYYKINF